MAATEPSPLLEVALAAHRAGLAVVPPKENGTKAPDGPWKRYQSAPPDEAQIRAWYANGRLGLGVLCGAASGHLEMLELDHGGPELWKAFLARAEDQGLAELVDRVVAGYAERTPGGGVHLLYRCTTPVGGNLKLARSVDPATGEVLVHFETRGEGGYVILAPSSGPVHPSGRAWELARGGFDTITTLDPDERATLLDLARSFDQMPTSEPLGRCTEVRQAFDVNGYGTTRCELDAGHGSAHRFGGIEHEPQVTHNPRPRVEVEGSWMDATIADFNARTTWAEMLAPHGWTEMRPSGGVGYWCRPGKDPRDGHSATTNANGTDRLVLWSTSVAIPGIEIATGPHAPSYDRFSVWAGYHHRGDRLEAAVAARQAGYGPPWEEAGERPDPWAMIGKEAPVAPGTPDEGWEQPLALEAPPPPPFPIAALPTWMARHCNTVAERLQVPIDLCAQLALGVLATVAMGHVKVVVRPSWVEHVNLYLTTVMPSGSGKSPADRAIVGPLRKLERQLLAQHANLRREAEVRLAVAERQAKKALEAATKDGSIADAILAEQAAAAIEVPPAPRLLAGDATPEVLAVLLDQHAGRIALVSTEAELYDLVLGIHGSRVNLGPYLKGWSGDELIVDRKGGSGSPGTQIRVPEAVLTVSITVQPSALEALRSKPELVGRGFVQRFCYAWPPSLVGKRTWDPDDDGDIPTAGDWEQRITELGTRLAAWEVPAVVGLGPDARAMFFAWRQQLEDALGVEADDGLAEFVAKLTGSVARLAALLHIAHTGGPGAVEGAVMTDALALGEYWLAHADAVWLQFGASGSLADARAVLAWLRRTRPSSFTRRDVYAGNRRRFRTADDAQDAIETLAEHGWIRVAGEGSAKGSSRTNPAWVCHPEVLR